MVAAGIGGDGAVQQIAARAFRLAVAPVPCSDGSRAITTFDLPSIRVLVQPRGQSQLCSANPAARLPLLLPSENHGGFSSLSSHSCGGSAASPRFTVSLPRRAPAPAAPAARRAWIHRRRCAPGTALAEDHALRVLHALIAQLNRLGVLRQPGLQNLARAVRRRSCVHVHRRFQLALVLVVGRRSGNHAGQKCTARHRRRCTATGPWPQRRASRWSSPSPQPRPTPGNGSTLLSCTRTGNHATTAIANSGPNPTS